MVDEPRVAVLMATCNGEPHIADQIRSILGSKGVSVTIILSDDGSGDATLAVARKVAGDRLSVLVPKRSNSAARNFFRLVIDADWSDFDYVALSDQDDVWNPGKLARAIDVLSSRRCAAYSSDVTAFWPSGRTEYIRKSQPQRPLDHLFESAGPGSTFVFPVREAEFLREKLRSADPEDLGAVRRHDWLIYAIFREANKVWSIDRFSGLRYRQHAANVQGASSGLAAKSRRLRQIMDGSFVGQAAVVARISGSTSPVVAFLDGPRPSRAWRLFRHAFDLRRSHMESVLLTTALFLYSLRRDALR